MDTVKIRVKIVVTSNGEWYSAGDHDSTDDENNNEFYEILGPHYKENVMCYYLTAEVPVPGAREIVADVVGDPGFKGKELERRLLEQVYFENNEEVK